MFHIQETIMPFLAPRASSLENGTATINQINLQRISVFKIQMDRTIGSTVIAQKPLSLQTDDNNNDNIPIT